MPCWSRHAVCTTLGAGASLLGPAQRSRSDDRIVDSDKRGHDNPGEWIGPIEGTAEMRDLQYPQVSSLSGTLDKAIGNCMRNTVRHLKASGAFTAAKN